VIDTAALRLVLVVLTGGLEARSARRSATFSKRIVSFAATCGADACSLTDDDRRRLAVRAYRLGRQRVHAIATIVAPDTLAKSTPRS
jgi:hypothetical protein